MNEALTTAIEAVKKDVEARFFPWVVEQIVIETPDQAKNMSDLLAVGKAIKKDAEAKLKAITDPIRASEKDARDAFKPLLNRIDLGITRLDQAILAYNRKVKAEADALLSMQAAEIANQQTDAKQTGEVVEQQPIITQPQGNKIRGNMGTTNVREVPEFTVVNEAEVDPSLKTTDMKKVKALYDYKKSQCSSPEETAMIQIPGILITVKQYTVSRLS